MLARLCSKEGQGHQSNTTDAEWSERLLRGHMWQGCWRAVVQILDRLTRDYAYSPQANCRKGGLLALAAAAVALAERKQVGVTAVLGSVPLAVAQT